MNQEFDQVLNNIRSSFSILEPTAQNVVAPFVFQGVNITPSDILNSLKSLEIRILNLLDLDIDKVLLSIHLPNIIASSSTLPSLTQQYVGALASPYADNLINHIWSINSSLFYISQNQRAPASGQLDSLARYLSRVKSSRDYISQLESLSNALENAYKSYDKGILNVELGNQKMSDFLGQAQQSLVDISNSQSVASSNAAITASSKSTLETLLSDIQNGILKNQELSKLVNNIKDKAESALGSSSQLSLAKSFRLRKNFLERSQRTWIGLFALGLVLLFGITFISVIYPDFYGFPPLVKNNSVDVWGIMCRILISGPLIWFSWFTVRRYSNNVFLIEDYAFKEASAYAFVGYKKDIDDDPEMLKLLRESAIKNFSYPPSRLLGEEHTSPAHELVDRALSDNNLFDKLIQMIKALKPSK